MLWRPARSEAANRPHRAAKACHPPLSSKSLQARGNVVEGVPCFGGPHGRRQRTGRTGPPKHATLGYVTFPFAACYFDGLEGPQGYVFNVSLRPGNLRTCPTVRTATSSRAPPA